MMRIAFFFLITIYQTLIFAYLESDLDVALNAINEEVTAESITLPPDATNGCRCRVYTKQRYIGCYDTKQCKEFPKMVHFDTRNLFLTGTGIRALHSNDFINNTQLTSLHIEANDEFHWIQPGAFNQMHNLLNLSITHNKRLMFLEPNALMGLRNLKLLQLSKNGFHSMKDFTYAFNPTALPTLKKLVIAQMVFPQIKEDDFEGLQGSALEDFSLVTCQMNYIHPASLKHLKQLKRLGLGENNLDTYNIIDLLGTFIDEAIELEYLNLFSLGMQQVPRELLATIGRMNVTRLSLTKNRFEIIEKFPHMPHIVRLDLMEVVALNITADAFANLPNLRILYLNRNKFSDVPAAVLLPKLTYLDLSYSGKYFSMQDRIFANMTSLEELNLSGNNIRKLSQHTFIGLANLKILGLQDATIYFIENATFVPLNNLLFLDLQNNAFPTRMLNKEIFQGLENLQVLLLGKCQISAINETSELFINLKNLRHLGLEGNALKTLPTQLFNDMAQLETIDISFNLFISWERRLFSGAPNLKTLYAHNNKVRNITRAMIKDFVHLTHLDLSQNQFSCSCDDMTALLEASSHVDLAPVLDVIYHSTASCSYPESLSNEPILDYLSLLNGTNLCGNDSYATTATLIIPAVVLVILALMCCSAIYAYRWHIKYWLFLTKLALVRKGKLRRRYAMNASFANYQYDAFVSYCNEDHRFVSDLVRMLESNEPFYKLCVYERDFQIGTMISESVLDCLTKSRKTLLVVSDAYIKSQWCRWEVQIAESRRLFFDECDDISDDLVIIKLGDVTMAKVNPMLKYMMKTRIYLEWDPGKAQLFWTKLRNTLAPPN